jgi:hypothetical protein
MSGSMEFGWESGRDMNFISANDEARGGNALQNFQQMFGKGGRIADAVGFSSNWPLIAGAGALVFLAFIKGRKK